jgi:hypothetical protein
MANGAYPRMTGRLPVHGRLALAAMRVPMASISTPPVTSIKVSSTIHTTVDIETLRVVAHLTDCPATQVGKPIRQS